MSSSDRRSFLALTATLALGACGFRPAFGTGGAAEGLLGRVSVDAPADRNGFNLVRRLEERLGRTKAPVYTLSFRIETSETGLGVTPDDTTTRYHVNGSVSFTLSDAATGDVLTSGKGTQFTAYSAAGTPLATESARTDAYLRLMHILADQIVTRLVATSGEWGRA